MGGFNETVGSKLFSITKKIWIFLMKVNNTIHLIKVCIVDIKLVYIVN